MSTALSNLRPIIRTFTAAAWTAANPTIPRGELCYESDTLRLKIGDGVTPWTTLPYFTGGGSGGSAPVGPAFTYTSGVLTRIDYDDGSYKLLTYTSNRLTRIDFVSGPTTIRKDFNYSGDVLASIDQTTL